MLVSIFTTVDKLGFQVADECTVELKVENWGLSVVRSRCSQNLNLGNFTLLFCWRRQIIVLKRVPYAQHDHFSSFNQSYFCSLALRWRQRQEQHHKLRIWLAERGNIIVQHVQHAVVRILNCLRFLRKTAWNYHICNFDNSVSLRALTICHNWPARPVILKMK